MNAAWIAALLLIIGVACVGFLAAYGLDLKNKEKGDLKGGAA